MSKRDIILFHIGRKTTGFSEKTLSESSEPAVHNYPFHPSFILRLAESTNQSFFGWFPMEYTMLAPAASPASRPVIELAPSSAARSSGNYLWKPPI